MIIPYDKNEFKQCVQLLIEAYNCPPWNNYWTEDTASRYLQEFVDGQRFVGFTLRFNDAIVGAAFCHEKTWWTNDELFIDELFISPVYQRRGYGTLLLQAIDAHCKSHKLAGYTLLTNKYMPAKEFYQKYKLVHVEQVVFMHKEV